MATYDLTANQFRVRGSSVPTIGQDIDSTGAMNDRREIIVANGLPSLTEIVRLGNSWNCAIPTGSAFTHVADMPTTRAELALYNNYGAGTNTTLIIDSIWYMALTSITAASGVTLIYQVSSSAAALTDNTAVLINSPVGKTYTGSAKRALAVTTMTANKWCALAAGPTGAAASIGHGIVAQVNGGIQLRPGATLGVNVVVGTATGTAIMGIAWHEAALLSA